MNSSVSIVIPLYNGAAFIPACLNAVLPQVRAHGAAEVIVVDNASTDDCDLALAPFNDAIRRHRMSFNTGFATAVNAGIQLSQGEIIVLLNQDAIVQDNWLNALLTRLEASPKAAIVGSKCLRGDGTVDHAGGMIRLPLFYTVHVGMGEPDSPLYNQPCQHDYVTGAALAVRRVSLERVGLLDQGFYPAYYEETDLCLRAREAGYEVWYEPAAVVLHQSSQTPLEQMTVDRIATFHRNRLRCLIKHTEPGHIGAVLRSAEVNEIDLPQAVALLTGRSIAYRDMLRAVLNGDAVLASRMMPDAIEALAQCYRQAYRRAEQVFDDATLSISRRIDMTPRRETWQDLQRGFEDIVKNLTQFAENAQATLRRIEDKPTESVSDNAELPATPKLETEAAPLDRLESELPADKQEFRGHSVRESAQSYQTMLLDLHGRISEIDSRLAQLARIDDAQFSPTLPTGRLEWLRATLRSIRALPAIAASVANLERRARTNSARIDSLIGETRGLAGHLADELIAQGQHTTQLAANVEADIEFLSADLSAQWQALSQLASAFHTQHRTMAQYEVHLSNSLAGIVRATQTACQFLHECITWQADVTRRVHELRRHTAALAESEAANAIIQALQATDINPRGSDSSA